MLGDADPDPSSDKCSFLRQRRKERTPSATAAITTVVSTVVSAASIPAVKPDMPPLSAVAPEPGASPVRR